MSLVCHQQTITTNTTAQATTTLTFNTKTLLQLTNQPTNPPSATMFANRFSSTESVFSISSTSSSTSSTSSFPAGCRDYQRSSSLVSLPRNTPATKSTYMPRGARDYEKLSPSEVFQSCLAEDSPAVASRRVPLGSLHYKRAIVASKQRSTSESKRGLLEKEFQF